MPFVNLSQLARAAEKLATMGENRRMRVVAVSAFGIACYDPDGDDGERLSVVPPFYLKVSVTQ